MRIAIGLFVVAACGGDDAGGGGGPDAAPPMHRGYVRVQSYDGTNASNLPSVGGTAIAGFFTSAHYCTTEETVGPCKVTSCIATPSGAVSAGTITMTGGAQPVMLVPGTDNKYTQLTATTKLFNGGESVTFAATGADVAAFSVSLTMPDKAMITAPAKPPSTAGLNIPRSQDFAVSWSVGGTGHVQIALYHTAADRYLFCGFKASAGGGAIPPAALAKLPAGTGVFVMASIAEGDHVAGDWGIDVSGYFNAVWPDNSFANGPATYE
jgi:hypothetical protein